MDAERRPADQVGVSAVEVMIELLVFAVVTFAISWTAGHAGISYPVRLRLNRSWVGSVIVSGLECFGCFSFHCGWLSYVLGVAPSPLNSWWKAAFFAAGANLVLARAAGLVEIAPEGGAIDRRREAADSRETEAER